MKTYDYLATITNEKGINIESFIVTSKGEQDTVFWNLRHLVDPGYNVNVQFLGEHKKPRKLIKISQ